MKSDLQPRTDKPKAVKTGKKPPAKPHHAEFTVFFDVKNDRHGRPQWETRIYHAETADERVIQGTDENAWVGWIRQKARLPDGVRPATADEAVTRKEAPTSALRSSPLEITHVELEQHRAGQLQARIGLRRDGKNGAPTMLRLEVYAVDLERQGARLLGSAWEQVEVERDLSLPLAVPEPGRYELHVQVYLLPPAQTAAYFRGLVFDIAS